MPKTRQEYKDWLYTKGYKAIGRGMYADVFRHPKYPVRVLKIGHDTGDAWILFALWAQSMDCQTLVKMYSFKMYDNFYVATLEHIPTIARTLAEDDSRALLDSMHSTRNLLSSVGMNNDLHEGNYGKRTDGSGVIFDPVCGTYSGPVNNTGTRRYKTGRSTSSPTSIWRGRPMPEYFHPQFAI